MAYAKASGLEYLGTQRESGEFGGCVRWRGRTVEFNADEGRVGRGGVEEGASLPLEQGGGLTLSSLHVLLTERIS